MRVVVIGSGIVGASAAYHLTRKGAEVTVVAGSRPGEATAAGAGIVCPWVDHDGDEEWYGLARAGALHYAELSEELDLGYRRVGALLVAEDPAELEPVRELLLRRRPTAPEMGEISDTDVKSFPPLDQRLHAIHVPGAARVDGRAVRDALLEAAQNRGAEVVHATATLTPDGDISVNGRSDGDAVVNGDAVINGGTVGSGGWDADAVVVAAGAWTAEVCEPLGVKLPIRPLRGQIVHATLEGVDTGDWPIILPRRGPYLLGFPGSRVVLGATREDAGFDPRVTMGGLDEVISEGLRLAPGLAAATVTEIRVGLRPVHAEGRPLITRLTDKVVVATALGAYGLTAGPFAGLLAAALALREPPPKV